MFNQLNKTYFTKTFKIKSVWRNQSVCASNQNYTITTVKTQSNQTTIRNAKNQTQSNAQQKRKQAWIMTKQKERKKTNSISTPISATVKY